MQARLVQSEKLASIGQVAAGVAHEVNNPTTYILTNVRRLNALAQALEDTSAGPLTPSNVSEIAAQVRDISADCEEGATRIKNIVASLGAFSRMPASRREPVQVNEIIESALKVLDERIRSAADVKRDYQELPRVMGDAGSLGQVALNLLMNALQAVEERGRRGRIEIRTSESRGWVVMELRDDGIGIGADVLPSIFDPFFRRRRRERGRASGSRSASTSFAATAATSPWRAPPTREPPSSSSSRSRPRAPTSPRPRHFLRPPNHSHLKVKIPPRGPI
nr:sensor histidine kinase/response regulator [uncultured bacterium]